MRTVRMTLARLAILPAVCLLQLAPQAGALAKPASYSKVTLPQDARMHPDAATEWWYYTGHLQDKMGGTYGFELVAFKFQGIKKLDPMSPSNTAYRTDFAITDESRGKFYSAVSYLAPSPGKTLMSTDSLSIRMVSATGSVSMQTAPGPDLAYRIHGALSGGSIDVTVHTARRPLLEGGTGVVPMGTGGYSYYYSLTNMLTSGTLNVAGRTVAVTGTTWMDHQWGNWKWSNIRGWDWMAVQLSNGTSVVLSNFAGSRMISKSAAASFPNGAQLTTRDSSMVPAHFSWTSPVTKVKYPQGWHVKVPAIGLDAEVLPTVPNQEVVDPLSLGPTYWEGSGRLTGTLHGKPITGLTYTELVGYGKRSALEM